MNGIDFNPPTPEQVRLHKVLQETAPAKAEPKKYAAIVHRRKRRSLLLHHVILEPVRTGWRATVTGAADYYTKGGPLEAITGALADDRLNPLIVGDGPQECVTCGQVNALLAISKKHENLFSWYCDKACAGFYNRKQKK